MGLPITPAAGLYALAKARRAATAGAVLPGLIPSGPSIRGTHIASAWDKRINAQQSRAGSEGREPIPPYTVSLGSIELSIYPPPTSAAVAQSANQVLSEVLSNSLEVLSARRTCCQLVRPQPVALLDD